MLDALRILLQFHAHIALTTMNNSTLSIQENMLQLESSCNFRDIGGYLTQDGRQVKRGMLFRSGVMAYFSEQDKQRIATLGIKVICDLRRSDERIDEPTAWPNIEDVKFIIERDEPELELKGRSWICLLYTSDAADES